MSGAIAMVPDRIVGPFRPQAMVGLAKAPAGLSIRWPFGSASGFGRVVAERQHKILIHPVGCFPVVPPSEKNGRAAAVGSVQR